MQITITTPTGTWDLTQLVTNIRWSGQYQQAARGLDLSILSSPSDSSIPRVDCPLGAAVQFSVGGEVLFSGFVTARTASTDGHTLDLSCMDRGFYLKRNKVMKKYQGVTPEAITAQLAAEFELEVGALAVTGIPVTRHFLTGTSSLYDVVATAYTLASRSTGEAYHIGYRGAKFFVTAKAPDERTLVLKGGSNLIAATTTESIEQTVTAVQVWDQNDQLVRELSDPDRLAQFGRLQEIVKQSAQDDKLAEAQKLLDDGGAAQKITVDCLGNIANVTGGCVVVQDPYTGLYGLFWIDSDTHEWKRGQYYNKLVLNYKRVMDEKEAGALPNADGKATGGSGAGTAAGGGGNDIPVTWDYHNKIQASREE